MAGVKFLIENPEGALLLDPGLRKTSMTLAAFMLLHREGKARRALVVAPPRVCRSVWPKEVKKWKDFEHLRVEVLHGAKRQEAHDREADIYCVSYEGLEWLFGITKEIEVRVGSRWLPYEPALLPEHGKFITINAGGKRLVIKGLVELAEAARLLQLSARKPSAEELQQRRLLAAAAVQFKAGKTRKIYKYDWTRFEKLGCDTLILDEISKLKHTDTARFQALKPALGKFKRRWGLTGSASANGLMNLFGIMYAIDLGKSLGQYITHFRRSFFDSIGYGGYTYVLKPEAEETIYARIAPYVFRLNGKDFLKLPKLVRNFVKVQLPDNARRVYDELEKEFITEVLDSKNHASIVTAVNTGAAGVKCRQVASGGLYLEQVVDDSGHKQGKRSWVDLHDEKVEAVADLIEELNGAPVIVTYDFQHDLARLHKKFGKDTPYIGGGISPRKSDEILRAWNAGKVPLLLAHFQSFAHGVNAQEGNAQHIIMHSLTYDFELYDQLIARLRRSGNMASHIFVHHIIAEDTIDEVQMLALEKKEKAQDSLYDAMYAYTLRRYGRQIKPQARAHIAHLEKRI